TEHDQGDGEGRSVRRPDSRLLPRQCGHHIARARRPLLIEHVPEHGVRVRAEIVQERAGHLDTRHGSATNGRDAVNIVQTAGGIALTEGRQSITLGDVQWVVQFSQLNPRPDIQVAHQPQIGVVNGLAVGGPGVGALLELEATAVPTAPGEGRLTITGLVEEETLGGRDRTVRRRSMARASVDNVLTALRRLTGLDAANYHIHLNFPGGLPVDGPSAGVAMATAIYSAVRGIPVLSKLAMTGEFSIRGLVRPVGGVPVKIEAARDAGAEIVLIPKDNWQESFQRLDGLKVIPVERFEDVLRLALVGGVDLSLSAKPASLSVNPAVPSVQTAP
ncbi:MAG: ATP-dependent protease LonB, partial [Alicyclobacillus shizuokensis]|nr:ATP-dependent protease LonB [Alicyclobacillus shizuokensis]